MSHPEDLTFENYCRHEREINYILQIVWNLKPFVYTLCYLFKMCSFLSLWLYQSIQFGKFMPRGNTVLKKKTKKNKTRRYGRDLCRDCTHKHGEGPTCKRPSCRTRAGPAGQASHWQRHFLLQRPPGCEPVGSSCSAEWCLSSVNTQNDRTLWSQASCRRTLITTKETGHGCYQIHAMNILFTIYHCIISLSDKYSGAN